MGSIYINQYPGSLNMVKSRAKTAAKKTTTKLLSRGMRKTRKSIDQDKKIDKTLAKIDKTITTLHSELSKFVTRKELNKRLSEL
jgi:septal ring factor EnvC (AmiA/AmiB activator)